MTKNRRLTTTVFKAKNKYIAIHLYVLDSLERPYMGINCSIYMFVIDLLYGTIYHKHARMHGHYSTAFCSMLALANQQ